MRVNRDNEPASWCDPIIHISADDESGYEIKVGYEIERSSGSPYWYPCASAWAGSRWSAKRKAQRLVRWYNRHVARQVAADEIEKGFAVLRSVEEGET